MIDLSGESPGVLADWLEAFAATQCRRPLSIQKLQAVSEMHASISPSLTLFALRELKRRSIQLGNLYPFRVDEEFIVNTESADENLYLNYLFLTSKAGLGTTNPAWSVDRAAQRFEELAEFSLSNFFGPETKTVNFAFPSRQGRPADFESAVKWLAQKAEIRIGAAYRPPRRKDGGVDLFVWKPFGDGRPGVPIMLVQCTVMEDFINKIGDIDIRLWSAWLSTDIEPLVALAVPAVVLRDEIWNEVAARGILLDRMRLCASTDARTPSIPKARDPYVTDLISSMASLVN